MAMTPTCIESDPFEAAKQAGAASYDVLGEAAQAAVRARWDEDVAERAATLDLAAEMTARGDSWAEADAAGNLVLRRVTE